MINPRRMHRRVTVVVMCVCLSVTTPAATYLICMSKARHHRVPCRLLKIHIMWISLKMFCSGDTACFAYHNDRRLSSLSTRNTPMILDMTRNSTVYELLARSDNYIKQSDFL